MDSGRSGLMGGITDDVPALYSMVMHRKLTLKSKCTFNWEDVIFMIKMVENGVLQHGKNTGLRILDRFGLEDRDEPFTAVEESAGMGESAVNTP